MIQNSSLKIAIVNSFKITTLTDEIDILATEIILYKYIQKLILNQQVETNDIQQLVNSYKTQYENIFVNLKFKYISYQEIYIFLKNNSNNNLLALTERDIDYVYSLYLKNSVIVQFNNKTFDIKMYSIENANNEEYNYLKKIHFNIIVPIIEYYNVINGIPIENMKIISSNMLPNNIGKRIDFTITGISPFIILNDIKLKKINIEYFDIYCEYPNIVLVNK